VVVVVVVIVVVVVDDDDDFYHYEEQMTMVTLFHSRGWSMSFESFATLPVRSH